MVRCATMIRNVFWMMKAPTNTATPAKASNPILRKLSPSLISAACSFCSVSPVTASTPAGRTPEIRAVSVSASTSGSAWTRMPVSSSPNPNTRFASSSSNDTRVAPSKLSVPPKEAAPTSSYSSGPMNPTKVNVSPIVKSAVLTVLRSRTTSPGPVGARPFPSSICMGFRLGISPQENPRVGGP